MTYEQTPPVGGDHNPTWLNCGVYTAPVPNELAVHALEHGAVWVTYRSDLPADQVERLVDVVPDTYMVVSPFEDLPAPVVASAWGAQLAAHRGRRPPPRGVRQEVPPGRADARAGCLVHRRQRRRAAGDDGLTRAP